MTCKTHPDAPHGFLRNASHSEGRYVCECEHWEPPVVQDLVFRLEERARIRRQIPTRKSVQEGAPDKIADLLEEAAKEIQRLRTLAMTDDALKRFGQSQYRDGYAQAQHDSIDPLDGPMIKLFRD